MGQPARDEHLDLLAELSGVCALPPGRARDAAVWRYLLKSENQRLAEQVARKWRSRATSPQDLMQTAQLGLRAAVEHWRGGSWGEWITCVRWWVTYQLQVHAAQHRVAHVCDDEMRSARKVQGLLRRGKSTAQVAAAMGIAEQQVEQLAVVPLSGGRAELSSLVMARASERGDAERMAVAAIDARRAGLTLDDLDADEPEPVKLRVEPRSVATRRYEQLAMW